MGGENTLINIPFLDIQISREFETKLLKKVIRYRLSGQNLIVDSWRSFLKAIRVEGFSKSPYKAPDNKILPLVQRHWLRDENLFALVVGTWVHDQEALIKKFSQWLSEKSEFKSKLEDETLAKKEIFRQLAQQFCHEFIEYEEEETYFTITVYKTGEIKFPELVDDNEIQSVESELGHMANEVEHVDSIPDYSQITSNSLRSELIQVIDLVLENLPNDIQDEEVKILIEVLENRINQTIKKRSEEQFLQLVNRKLDELKQILAQNSSYFEFEAFQDWSISHLPSFQLETISELINEFRALINHHAEIKELTPKNREERKKIQEELDEYEEKIEKIYLEIKKYFDVQPFSEIETSEEPNEEILIDEASSGIAVPANLDEVAENWPESESVSEQEEIETLEDLDQLENYDQNKYVSDLEEGLTKNFDISVASGNESLSQEPLIIEEESESENFENIDLKDREQTEILSGEEIHEVDKTPLQEEEANAYLIRWLSKSNLPRAYWLAEAMTKCNMRPVVPSWLLAGIQGCHWLIQKLPEYPSGLIQDIRDIASPKHNSILEEHSIWALNLGICMSLIEQKGVGWEDWLTVDIPSVPLLDLISKLDKFVSEGNTLDVAILEVVLNEGKIDQQISEVVVQAKKWLEYAPNRRTRFKGADEVWKELIKQKSQNREIGITEWLTPVTLDERSLVKQVKEHINSGWKDRRWVDDYIQRVFRQMKSNKRFTIEGAPRDQLIRMIGEAVSLADRWCDLLLSQELSAEKEWLLKNTTQLIQDFRYYLPKAREDVERLCQKYRGEIREAAYITLLQTLDYLGSYLQITNKPKLNNDYDPQKSLRSNLANYLLLCPPLPLDNEVLLPQKYTQEHVSILARSDYSSQEAHQIWIKYRDYRFLNQLEDKMARDEAAKYKYEADLRLEEDCRKLEFEAEETIKVVEQALLDGLLNEEEHNTMISEIERSRAVLIKVREGNTQICLNQHFEKFNRIVNDIEEKQKNRIQHLREKWEQIIPYLPELLKDSYDSEEIKKVVETNLNKSNLRVVNEILSEFDGAIQGKPLFLSKFLGIRSKDYSIKKFLEGYGRITELVRQSNPEYITESLVNQKHLPQDRQKEIKEAILSWFQLKSNHYLKDSQKTEHLLTILRYLGFECDPVSPLVSVEHPLPKFERYILNLKPRVPSPVPQFGSLRFREGIKNRIGKADFANFDVILVWDRPGKSEIENFANKINKRPAILLYFGRMNLIQRSDFLRLTKSRQLPFLLIDDVLIAYLASEYEVRLQAMFECTLPYAYVNPYVPFATGSVPPEMFFGRESEINRLLDPYGPAIVYGGRQLGKSALLRQVQNRFEQSGPKYIAIYEDIRLIGTVETEQDYRRELLERLTEALKHEGLFASNRSFEDFSKFTSALIEKVREKDLRILLLLDEADNFLEADAGRDFQIVSHLKRVMDQTNRRFRVVFAGLHHVQRFKNVPNQPLSHLGDAGAVEVGPLEPAAAFDLIKKPFQTLGYYFGDRNQEDPSLIYLILSYTNYHPGLLQLFGQHLVDYLNQKSNNGNPPYPISRDDINAIYRKPEVRENIKDRFNITLKLDDRYEAIVLSLITQQWDEQNGFDRLYTPEELYSICRADWKAGFEEVSMDRFKGFLEEMRGLGVLSLNYEGGFSPKYRLRSPNLVSLMGTRDQVLDRLAEISKSEVTSQKRKLESYRTFINPYYSPLTRNQESMIKGNRSGVCLVFGSSANNISALSSALEKVTMQVKGKFKEIKVSAGVGDAIQNDLKRFLQEQPNTLFLIALRDLEGYTSEQIIWQVESAIKFCRQMLKDRKQTLRVVFQFGPFSTRNWFNIPEEKRIKIEQEEVDVVISLNRWDKVGIQQILERHEPEWQVSDLSIRKIIEATGGWQTLVDRFIKYGEKESDIEVPLRKLKEYLENSKEVVGDFVNDLGIVEPKAKEFITHRLEIGEKFSEKELQGESTEVILELMDVQDLWIVDYLRRLSILGEQDHFPVEKLVSKIWRDVVA